MSKFFKIVILSIFIFNFAFLSPGHSDITEDRENDIKEAVVKIFVTANRMDFYRPWQSLGNSSKTGSGCVIPGNRILTNAHIVADQTFIQVRKESDPTKYTARLLAIGHDCDLAILTVDNPDFFKGIIPLKMGELPNLKETVSVIGYPEGGDKISFTEGVVSRIEITSYSQSARKLLSVQIDAAINPGNSGGPVIRKGKLVGIAMQALASSQNIGYMIPTPIIQHFFDDLQDNHYDGFPSIGIDIFNTENQTMRDYFKIPDLSGGVLVSKVMPFSAGSEILEKGDIILSINDIPIGVDGTYEFRKKERLYLAHIISQHQINDEIKLKIMRDGKEMNVTTKLIQYTSLVPFPNHYDKPTYYIWGGLVFTVLSSDLLVTWGSRWWERAPLDFIYYLIGAGRYNDQKRKEIVVLLQVLPDAINVGYHDISNQVISTIDGQPINSFEDLVNILQNRTQRFTVIKTEHNLEIILDNTNIEKTTEEIIKRNNIPFQFSDDVGTWLHNSAQEL